MINVIKQTSYDGFMSKSKMGVLGLVSIHGTSINTIRLYGLIMRVGIRRCLTCRTLANVNKGLMNVFAIRREWRKSTKCPTFASLLCLFKTSRVLPRDLKAIVGLGSRKRWTVRVFGVWFGLWVCVRGRDAVGYFGWVRECVGVGTAQG